MEKRLLDVAAADSRVGGDGEAALLGDREAEPASRSLGSAAHRQVGMAQGELAVAAAECLQAAEPLHFDAKVQPGDEVVGRGAL